MNKEVSNLDDSELFNTESMKQLHDSYIASLKSDLSWMEPDEIDSRLKYIKNLENNFKQQYQKAKRTEFLKQFINPRYIKEKSKILHFIKYYNPICTVILFLFSICFICHCLYFLLFNLF